MQKQTYTHIILGIIVAVVAGLNYTYGLKISVADVLTAATTLIGIAVIIAHAIITHGQLTSTEKNELPAELAGLFGTLIKLLESTSAKQTGTAPEGSTTTTNPPPAN